MPCPFLPLLYARSCPISSVLSVPPCSVPPAFAAGALAAIPLPSPMASNQLSPRAQCGLFRGAQEDSHPPLAPGCPSKVSCHGMAKDIATSCRFRRSFAHIGDPGCFQSSAGSWSNAYIKVGYTSLGHKKTSLQGPAFLLCNLPI